MTRLFIRFYAGVLIVLFLAWYIYGTVLKQRSEADLARVVVEAHSGGARLVAGELEDNTENRDQTLKQLSERFGYPIALVDIAEIPISAQKAISRGEDVAFVRFGDKQIGVASRMNGTDQVVQIGPFPNYDLREIEKSMRGWTRLAADSLNSAPPEERNDVLVDVQSQFAFPVELSTAGDLPDWPRYRLSQGDQIAFYSEAKNTAFAVTPLEANGQVIRFGPFPSFEEIEQKAATTTLALVLFPAALAIALLLRPVAGQLRQMENAAKSIAAGDLSTRVDERRMRSARPLAHAFNHMAGRTESLVRTQRELLQAVSHELRTPLARMRFAIDLIGSAKNENEREERLASLDAATEELDELVGELLTYVRMETTTPPLNCEDIAIQEMIDVLISKFAALYPKIGFSAAIETSDPLLVVADRTEFKRAIGNLINNAGQHAQSRVRIGAIVEDESVVIDVDDDGLGIAEADRGRAFDPFVRLDDCQESSGAGLGLALVQRIVTKHGGAVSITTSPYEGCRVRTIWPVDGS